jgi:hypothetical protein
MKAMQKYTAPELGKIVDLLLAGLTEADDQRSHNLIQRAMTCMTKLAGATENGTVVDTAIFNAIWLEAIAFVKARILKCVDGAMPALIEASSAGTFEQSWRDCLGSSSPIKVS